MEDRKEIEDESDVKSVGLEAENAQNRKRRYKPDDKAVNSIREQDIMYGIE